MSQNIASCHILVHFIGKPGKYYTLMLCYWNQSFRYFSFSVTYHHQRYVITFISKSPKGL